jgi:hypothetical protein
MNKYLFMIALAVICLVIAGCSESLPSAPKVHENHTPTIPSNPSPACGDTGSETVMYGAFLSWDCSDPDTEDIITYNVYADTINPPSVLYWTTNSSMCQLRGTPNKTYYWFIKAQDQHGAESIGPVWYFYLIRAK